MTPWDLVHAAAWAALVTAFVLPLYAYAGYPLILWALDALRRAPREGRAAAGESDLETWPSVSVVLAVYNERAQVREVLDTLLAVDYPAERRQILVISDASDDGTDDIVRSYADRGVELLRMDGRSGKTAAENAALPHIRGEIVINTDASVRLHRGAVKPLVRALHDPDVGVASGRDVSVAPRSGARDTGESGYVGYEMAVRELENRAGGIVGASGCLYAIRRELHAIPLPEHLSRDFASALVAREHGFRAVSVADAICYVPRAGSLQREYRRKVRTFTRGIQTLAFKRHLLNPARVGVFAWKLLSHKVCRWAVPVAAAAALPALGVLAGRHTWAAWALWAAVIGICLGALGMARDARGRLGGRLLSVPSYVLAGNLAALQALARAMGGRGAAVWEPTRRDLTTPASGPA